MAAAAVHRPPSSRPDHDPVARPWSVQIDVPCLPPGRPPRCVFVHLSHRTDQGLEPVAAFSVPRLPDESYPERLRDAVSRLLARRGPPAPEAPGEPLPPPLFERLEILVDQAAAEVRRQTPRASGVWSTRPPRPARGTSAGGQDLREAEDAVRVAHAAVLAARERQERARYLRATCPGRHFGGPSRLHAGLAARSPEHDRDGDLAAAREEERCSERLVAARNADLARALEHRDRVASRAPGSKVHS